MNLKDDLYGSFEIDDGVLCELIESAPIQRLKGVSQSGDPKEAKHRFTTYSRYDHSVGVMLLLRMLNASLEEQVAGLLHDSSHTAFSHVIDWVLGDPTKSEYQDKTLKEYINKSVLKEILTKYGFDSEKISNLEYNNSYSLLESKSPNLCADRIDYTLRDVHHMLKEDLNACVGDLTVYKGEIIFKSRKYASQFGNWYMECERTHWGSDYHILRYHLLANAFRMALEKKVLSLSDFYKDESAIIKTIRESKDKELRESLELALGDLKFTTSKNGAIELKAKFRYIDPKFLENGKLARLSEVSEPYKKLIEEEKQKANKPLRVDLLK